MPSRLGVALAVALLVSPAARAQSGGPSTSFGEPGQPVRTVTAKILRGEVVLEGVGRRLDILGLQGPFRLALQDVTGGLVTITGLLREYFSADPVSAQRIRVQYDLLPDAGRLNQTVALLDRGSAISFEKAFAAECQKDPSCHWDLRGWQRLPNATWTSVHQAVILAPVSWAVAETSSTSPDGAAATRTTNFLMPSTTVLPRQPAGGPSLPYVQVVTTLAPDAANGTANRSQSEGRNAIPPSTSTSNTAEQEQSSGGLTRLRLALTLAGVAGGILLCCPIVSYLEYARRRRGQATQVAVVFTPAYSNRKVSPIGTAPAPPADTWTRIDKLRLSQSHGAATPPTAWGAAHHPGQTCFPGLRRADLATARYSDGSSQGSRGNSPSTAQYRSDQNGGDLEVASVAASSSRSSKRPTTG